MRLGYVCAVLVFVVACGDDSKDREGAKDEAPAPPTCAQVSGGAVISFTKLNGECEDLEDVSIDGLVDQPDSACVLGAIPDQCVITITCDEVDEANVGSFLSIQFTTREGEPWTGQADLSVKAENPDDGCLSWYDVRIEAEME